MKKYVTLFCVLAIIMLGLPTGETNAMAKLDPALVDMSRLDPAHRESEFLPVIIRLQNPCVIGQVTFGGKFTTNTQELNNPENITRSTALSRIMFEQKNSVEIIKTRIKGIKILNSYQVTTNSLRAIIPRNSMKDIAELPCVSYVWYEAPLYPTRWHSREPMNCWPVYRGETDLDGEICLDPEGREVNGKGIVCSVSDTGLDYTHPDFGSQSRPEGAKVIISHDFGDTDNDCQEEEEKTSHGTACAGIIAADGPGQEKGIAPKALLAGYKISGPSGDLTGDVAATWETMVKEEIDVSNNSFSSPRGYSPMNEAQNNAVSAGVCVVAGNGNWGSPGPKLPVPCGSFSSPENVIGVGATEDYATFSKIIISDAPDMDSIGKELKGLWGSTGKDFEDYNRPLRLVDCGWGRKQDFSGLQLRGKVALIWRGPSDEYTEEHGDGVFFSEKLLNASQAGAVAVLLYNHSPGFLSVPWELYSYGTSKGQQDEFLPCLELLQSQGLELREMLHTGHEWKLGKVDKKQNEVFIKITKPAGYANITSFTSQGPSINGSLKPDVCAPGSNIRSTNPRWMWDLEDRSGNKYGKYTDSFGGTSAAGPFVCGVACLVRQARPKWNPFEVKRAIMNTANLLRRYKDDSYIPLLSQGMGRVDGFNSCMTDILIQPPSALIVAATKRIQIDDPPSEWIDKEKKSKLPNGIKQSMIAFKVYNYNEKEPHNIELSYEINSRQAEDFKISFSSKNITIPPGTEDNPSSSWVGIDVEWTGKLIGNTNDIIIWFTDKNTGQKWHTGVCIYNNDPEVQGEKSTYTGNIGYSFTGLLPIQTPNGDGVDDGLDISFSLTNGSYNQWMESYKEYGYIPYYSNYANGVSFMLKDYNLKTWKTIYSDSVLELGEHNFSWNGKDDRGKYVLPDGEWYLGSGLFDKGLDKSAGAMVDVYKEHTFFEYPFQVKNSVVPSLVLVSAHPIPSSPGVGTEFELGIYVEHAKNLKTIQFSVVIPGLGNIAKFMGVRQGDFMSRNSDYGPLTTVEQDDGSDSILVNIQRSHDGVSGEGWLIFLRFLPITSNYIDISFENLNISYINEETGEEEYGLAFYKSSSFAVERKYFEPADFNRDGKVDKADMDILKLAMGSKRGEERFNWRCDLDRNGIIDMHDMVLFAQAMD